MIDLCKRRYAEFVSKKLWEIGSEDDVHALTGSMLITDLLNIIDKQQQTIDNIVDSCKCGSWVMESFRQIFENELGIDVDIKMEERE